MKDTTYSSLPRGSVSAVPVLPPIRYPAGLAVYAVAYAPDLSQSAMGIAARSADTVSIVVPSSWRGKTIHIWGFVQTSVTMLTEIEEYGIELAPGGCSNASYIGTGEVS